MFRSFGIPVPEASYRLNRVQVVERNLVLPLRLFAIGIIFYSLNESPWFGMPLGSLEITVTTINTIFAAYVGASAIGACLLLLSSRLPFPLVQWTVFSLSLIDGIFVAILTLISGGYDSPLFWLFVVLIVRNAASHPPVWSQLALNLGVSLCFAAASFIEASLNAQIAEEISRPVPIVQPSATRTNRVAKLAQRSYEDDMPNYLTHGNEGVTEEVLIRLSVLALVSICAYAVQTLLERQRIALEEAREFSTRERQLRTAGRLAAEFAHQIKNPLAIVNNAVFSLERGLKIGKGDPSRHLRIIQEEISRADQIITQVMGYAELSEGHVEKLSLISEIQKAVTQSFPEGLHPGIEVKLDLPGPFPPMLMQKRHLSEIFLNLLLNAREALDSHGHITVSARVRQDLSVEVVVADDGPGIPADKLDRIFEAFFTTKQRGTGLGLAIVKNNIELYGGTVRAESRLGNGARFTLVFPAKASMRLVP